MTYDTIIIGGGIIGCTTAFHLSRKGQKVLLLERDKIATGTTGNSFAWANASVKTTDRTYHNLNAAGVKGYNALQDEFGNETPGIDPTGALEVVSKSDTDGYKAMQAQARALTAFGYANRWVSNAPPLRHMYYSAPKNELHILPEFNGGLKIASDDIDGMIIEDQAPDHLRKTGQLLLDRAYTLLPQLTGTIDIVDCDLGIGVRPYPTDGKTIIGPMPDAKGLHIIATHSGITLAPVLGKLMAEAITTGSYPEMLAPFGLTRFTGFA